MNVLKCLWSLDLFKNDRVFIHFFSPGTPKWYDDDEFIDKLKDIEDFSLQLNIFKSNLQIDSSVNYQHYNRVYQDLCSTLREYFPFCEVNPFGSTMTGLGFKNSDVDVYISGITAGTNAVQYLYTVKDILNRSRKFTNIVVIAHAKIPIVKCFHKETHVNCDINLKNMLGVCNSNLIRYYVGLDNKIKDVLLVLKYWARVHKITGQNHLFTNYSLCLMVIFFLQQKPYNLPSVLHLQHDDRFFDKQDNWNGGFKPLILYKSTIETLKNTTCIAMLVGFFKYYSDFDYNTLIICPYLGKPLEKDLFKFPEKLPNYYDVYKEFIEIEDNQPLKVETCICMQDPLEHSRNTTSVILNTVLDKFVNFCRLGKKLCDAGTNKLLFKLFTEDLQFQKVIGQVSASNDSASFQIVMKTNLIYLKKKLEKSEKISDGVAAEGKAWFETVIEFMKIMLKDFLDFDIHEDTEALPAKNMRENDQTSVHDNNNFHFKCSGKLNCWDNRKNKLKELQNKDFAKKNFVEKEVSITESIKSGCGFTPTANILEVNIFVKFHTDPTSVDINIKKKSSYKNTFKSFSNFFVSNFKAWFLQYEQMLNLQ